MSEPSLKNQGSHRFKKGVSGNPAGKPAGTKARATLLAEKLMAADQAAVVKAVIERAKGGDMTAAKIILDRLAPVRKGRPVHLAFPPVKTAGDIAAAMASVTSAMASGELTPDEASAVASVLELRRKTIETSELEARIRRLEIADGIA